MLARAALWSARREMPRDGNPSALPADGPLSLRQWKNAKGEVTSWQLDYKAEPLGTIRVQAPETLPQGEDIAVRFDPVDGLRAIPVGKASVPCDRAAFMG